MNCCVDTFKRNTAEKCKALPDIQAVHKNMKKATEIYLIHKNPAWEGGADKNPCNVNENRNDKNAMLTRLDCTALHIQDSFTCASCRS